MAQMLSQGAPSFLNTSYGENNRSPSFVAAGISDMVFKPSQIEPSWILSGNPRARIAVHSEASDNAATTAMWDCTAGEFLWYFGWDETVYILEGEVEVTAEDGSVKLLKAGDIGYFAGRTWAKWKIETYVRKIAFCRKPMPLPVTVARKLVHMFRGALDWRPPVL
jgi:uncharacterized protein